MIADYVTTKPTPSAALFWALLSAELQILLLKATIG